LLVTLLPIVGVERRAGGGHVRRQRQVDVRADDRRRGGQGQAPLGSCP
jgi:hypothetical protein